MGQCCAAEPAAAAPSHAPPPASHAVRTTNTHVTHYPDHPPRAESARYRRTRDKLVRAHGCYVCEAKAGLEAHHFFVESAAALAIDWKKFELRAKTLYNPQTGENLFAAFVWGDVRADPETFVDSPQNMVVLCLEHHRSGARGIHHVPFPEWVLQLAPLPGFEFLGPGDEKKADRNAAKK